MTVLGADLGGAEHPRAHRSILKLWSPNALFLGWRLDPPANGWELNISVGTQMTTVVKTLVLLSSGARHLCSRQCCFSSRHSWNPSEWETLDVVCERLARFYEDLRRPRSSSRQTKPWRCWVRWTSVLFCRRTPLRRLSFQDEKGRKRSASTQPGSRTQCRTTQTEEHNSA